MLCAICKRWQPKSLWSPAQWTASKPVLLDLQRNCCADCGSGNWAAHMPMQTPETNINDHCKRMLALAAMINTAKVEPFMKGLDGHASQGLQDEPQL